ncbi:MAG: alpha/beta fold hydrolase [Granulosicoccaceae bacterium]
MIELSLESLGTTLAGLRGGDSADTPCLCLHGWMDNAASFIPLQAALPEQNLVALDAPGHGKSAHLPAGQPYNLLDQVGYVLAAADALGWREFNLFGHSLGGCIAPFVAVAAPERVRQLVMIEALGPLTEEATELPARLQRAYHAMRQDSDRLKRIYTSVDDAVDARMAATKMRRDSARLIVERNLCSVEGGHAWRYDSRLRMPSAAYLTEAQVLAVLKSVTQQTLVVLAVDGYLHKRKESKGRLEALRDASVAEVSGHHHMHMDDPEPTAAAVRAFLR